MRLRTMFVVGVPLVLMAAAPFGYSLTRTVSLPKLAMAKADDGRKAAQKLCAARIVNDRLKAQLFNEAAAVGGGASSNLDLLASFSEVRMEQPVVKAQDHDLGVTVCEGRFVLLLPPGSERGFGGMRVLSAKVEYAAQPAADGSGLVYQLRGADSIVYRIAAFSLRNHSIVPRGTQLADAEPLQEMPLAVEPAVWPELAKPEEPAPEEMAPPDPPVHLQLAKAEKQAPPKPPEPVKLAKAEPKKPETLAKADPTPTKPAQIAKAEPKPKVPVRAAEKSEPKAKKEPVRLAAKDQEKKPKKAEPKAKPTALAEAVKKEPRAATKAKPKEQKPTRLAEATKSASKKPVKKEPVTQLAQKKPAGAPKPKAQLASASKKPAVEAKPKTQLAAASKKPAADAKPKTQLASAPKTPAAESKPKTQLAAAPKKPVVEAKPKVQLAAAPKKPAEPQRDLATNSFLAYEQSRQRKDVPASESVREPPVQRASAPPAQKANARLVQRASAPVVRDTCDIAGGVEARLLCSNPGLAPKQRAATNFYYAAMEQAGDQARRVLAGSRNRFLAYLNRCRSAACASAAYDDRMAEIRDIMREY